MNSVAQPSDRIGTQPQQHGAAACERGTGTAEFITTLAEWTLSSTAPKLVSHAGSDNSASTLDAWLKSVAQQPMGDHWLALVEAMVDDGFDAADAGFLLVSAYLRHNAGSPYELLDEFRDANLPRWLLGCTCKRGGATVTAGCIGT